MAQRRPIVHLNQCFNRCWMLRYTSLSPSSKLTDEKLNFLSFDLITPSVVVPFFLFFIYEYFFFHLLPSFGHRYHGPREISLLINGAAKKRRFRDYACMYVLVSKRTRFLANSSSFFIIRFSQGKRKRFGISWYEVFLSFFFCLYFLSFFFSIFIPKAGS